MTSYRFLLDLSIILLSTKVLGILSEKIHMPQVVGALLAGLILGPSILNVVVDSTFLNQTAELGVIVLLFLAGLKVDLSRIRKSGKASVIIAILGVIFPMIIGFGISYAFKLGADSSSTLGYVFIGVILTATSVSISVETLVEMGKLDSDVGTTIMTAALIDDILGIVLLSIVSGFVSSNTGIGVLPSILIVVLKVVAFFVFAAVIGHIFHKVFQKYSHNLLPKRRFPIIALSFCFLMSFIAEHYFGMADITGAFVAGMVFINTEQAAYIHKRIDTLAYLYLTPIFFTSIGISSNLRTLSGKLVLFGIVLLVLAMASKIIGCGLGAKLSSFENLDSLRIGIGMSARSEVALIVANTGVTLGVISPTIFPIIILLVIGSSILTPILLKISYSNLRA